MNKLEALADAISFYNAYSDPQQPEYKLRNPGGLRGYLIRHQVPKGELRQFKSVIDGYRALLYDLEEKCSGRSASGLTADSPLVELVRVYGMKDETTRYIVKFLRKAGLDVNESTPISFFEVKEG